MGEIDPSIVIAEEDALPRAATLIDVLRYARESRSH